MNSLSCQQFEHEQEPINAICIHKNCDEPSWVCLKCIVEKHSQHLEECKVISDLRKTLNKNYDEMNNKMQQYKCEFEDYQAKFNSMLKNIEREMNQVKAWISLLEHNEYKDPRLKNMISTLKKRGNSDPNQVLLDEVSMCIPTLKPIENEFLIAGTKLQDQFKFKDALEHFKTVLKIDGLNFRAEISKGVILRSILCLGICLLRLNKLDKAIQSFDRAHALNEFDYSPYYWKGIALRKKKLYQSALRQLEEAGKIKGQDKEILIQIGITLSKQNLSTSALSIFDQALNMEPYYEEAYFAKGKCLIRNNQLSQALDCFNYLLVIRQLNCPKAYLLGGQILINQGKFDKAKWYLQNSIDIVVLMMQQIPNESRNLRRK